jgi:hypothetical protein
MQKELEYFGFEKIPDHIIDGGCAKLHATERVFLVLEDHKVALILVSVWT